MILLLLGLLTVAFLVHQCWYRRRDLPPGPFPLPLIGNMHYIWSINRWEDQFLKWKNEYGPIYTLWMGPVSMITVNSYEKCVELFVKDGDSFIDRVPIETMHKALSGGVYGIFETSGSLWLEQRRFSIRVLRDFGLGKNKMQDRILEEFETMFENVQSDIKMGLKEHDFHMHTDIATGSIINAVLNGFRFTNNGNEAKFFKLKALTKEIMNSFTDPLLMMSLMSETLLKLPVFRERFQKMIGHFRGILDFMEDCVEQHEEWLVNAGEDVEPRDFVDAYLLEQKKLEDKGDNHYFSRVQLLNVLSDLWFAGQESTSNKFFKIKFGKLMENATEIFKKRLFEFLEPDGCFFKISNHFSTIIFRIQFESVLNTLTWCIAYMIENEDIQKRLHDELDSVIGTERLITVADRSSLPFTNAVIMESQRMANIISQNVFRKAARDVEIDGLLIKKGSIVIPQISVLAIDPENFKDPKKFHPSRFIDENGQLKKCDELMPFSLGKRACSGEGLARMELYIFIANIFNRFKLSAGKKRPTFKKVGGGSGFATEPYKIRIQQRHQ